MTALGKTGPFILYVDDDVANRKAFEYVFDERLSFAVAATAEEALEMMEKAPPAVLLADHRMPGMTGVELCEVVRERFPSVLRMILTAYADLGAVVDAINRGAVHRYLQKPYDDEHLLYTLNEGLRVWAERQRLASLEKRVLDEAPSRVAALVKLRIWHELKNLVQPLHTHIQLLEEELPDGAGEARALLDDLRGIYENLNGFADQLRSAPKAETSNAGEIVETVARLFQRDHRRPVIHTTIESKPTIPMGAVSLTQVLYNLLRNAERFDAENVTIRVWSDQEHSYVQIQDDGPGIPEAAAKRIFDEQFTTHQQGSGLGLSTSRQLVAQGDGELQLIPSKRGACFLLTFHLL